MAATLRLKIVTPEGETFSDDVEMVTIPGVAGEFGVLPQHVPLMTALNPGELKIETKGKNSYLAVGEGFVEVTGTSVSVLTDMAVEESDIDEAAAQAAVERAQEAMRSEKMSGEEVAAVQASLQKSLAQLHVKRRRHS